MQSTKNAENRKHLFDTGENLDVLLSRWRQSLEWYSATVAEMGAADGGNLRITLQTYSGHLPAKTREIHKSS